MFGEYAQTASLAVMCLEGGGKLLFATVKAQDLCERWNNSLDDADAAERELRLPNDIGGLFTAAHGGLKSGASASMPEMPARWSVHHPSMPELALTVDAGHLHSESNAESCYMLCFEERIANPRLQSLSPSERRVALLAAEGLRNDAIARHLCRSRRTVEFQLNSVYRKLDVSCRTQLVRALL